MSIIDSWFVFPRPKPLAKVRLICFPYAGGGAPTFGSWISTMPEEVELCVVQLPGRGTRFNERPFVEMSSLTEALAAALPALLDRSFAFFGHSLGALVCFEAARALQSQGLSQSGQLFVSACSAPSTLPMISPIHALPDEAFVAELQRFNETPVGALENDELLTLMLPTLRADFALFDSYVYSEDLPLAYPITALGGRDDELVDQESLALWQTETNGDFTLQLLPGDHFYIHSSQQDLLAYLSERLVQQASGRPIGKNNHG